MLEVSPGPSLIVVQALKLAQSARRATVRIIADVSVDGAMAMCFQLQRQRSIDSVLALREPCAVVVLPSSDHGPG